MNSNKFGYFSSTKSTIIPANLAFFDRKEKKSLWGKLRKLIIQTISHDFLEWAMNKLISWGSLQLTSWPWNLLEFETWVIVRDFQSGVHSNSIDRRHIQYVVYSTDWPNIVQFSKDLISKRSLFTIEFWSGSVFSVLYCPIFREKGKSDFRLLLLLRTRNLKVFSENLSRKTRREYRLPNLELFLPLNSRVVLYSSG